MGACIAKLGKRKEKGSGNKTKQAEKNIRAGLDSGVDDTQRRTNVPVKKKTLRELQKECPPGFAKFELEVQWQTMDEDIALQLWEDVFKPLYW